MKTMHAASKQPCLVESLAKFRQAADAVFRVTYKSTDATQAQSLGS